MVTPLGILGALVLLATGPDIRGLEIVGEEAPTVQPLAVSPDAPAPHSPGQAPREGRRVGPEGNPVFGLSLSGPHEIGRKEAETILRGMGLLAGQGFWAALGDLRFSHSYVGSRRTVLTARDRAWLYADYVQLRAALARYADTPTLTRAHPAHALWIDEASAELAHVDVSHHRRLVEVLLDEEASGQHWIEFVPIQSTVGATGFGQLLAATATAVGVNRFDPRENVVGLARYLDTLIARYGVLGGLARYNGGVTPPASSWHYARTIARRAGLLQPARRQRRRGGPAEGGPSHRS